MFRRRSKQPIIFVLRSLFWPGIGLARAYKYIWYRVNRLPAGPHSIASGLATGCAMSFTPLIGVHFFVAAGLAWIIRGNVVASAFGTIVGNPWTFPVIWILTYELGSIILGLGSFSTPSGQGCSVRVASNAAPAGSVVARKRRCPRNASIEPGSSDRFQDL